MTGVSKARKRACAMLGASSLLALTIWPTGSADAAPVFTTQAEAYPFRSATANPTNPLGVTLEGFGPYARAKLDSLGSSDAVASAPYPGEVASGGSGLAQSVTGVQLPDYPFFLLSAAGDDPKQVNYPFSSLSTESGSGAAVAKATLGSDFSGSDARARAERLADGSAQAIAESSFDVLELGNNVTIRGLRTVARVVADPYGKLTRTSDLSFQSITAPGLRYETPCAIPPQIPVPGALPCTQSAAPTLAFANGQFFFAAPDGTKQAAPLDSAALAGAFKNAGIAMTYQAPQQTKDGIIGSGITIEFNFPEIPDNPSGYEGVTNQKFAIGFSSATATLIPEQQFGVVGGNLAVTMLGALGLFGLARVVRPASARSGS